MSSPIQKTPRAFLRSGFDTTSRLLKLVVACGDLCRVELEQQRLFGMFQQIVRTICPRHSHAPAAANLRHAPDCLRPALWHWMHNAAICAVARLPAQRYASPLAPLFFDISRASLSAFTAAPKLGRMFDIHLFRYRRWRCCPERPQRVCIAGFPRKIDGLGFMLFGLIQIAKAVIGDTEDVVNDNAQSASGSPDCRACSASWAYSTACVITPLPIA